MKSQIKERIRLIIILFISILIIGLLIFVIYDAVFSPKVTTGVIGQAKVIDINDKENISILNRQSSPYAFKIQEVDKFYLQTYGLGVPSGDGGKYILKKKQFDDLQIGEAYWFEIKYYKPYNGKTGIVKRIYLYSPYIR